MNAGHGLQVALGPGPSMPGAKEIGTDGPQRALVRWADDHSSAVHGQIKA